jgi:hypothetical protein
MDCRIDLLMVLAKMQAWLISIFLPWQLMVVIYTKS